MTGGRFARRTVSLLLTMSAAACTYSQSQQAPVQSENRINAEQAKAYAGAHPYMDEPLSDLKKAVRELAGLKPAPSQPQTADLLSKVGAKADELLHKVPDLVSDEAVSQTRTALLQGQLGGCTGPACISPGTNSATDRSFNYLILTRPAPDGRLAIQEYRTTGNGKAVLPGAGAPNFQGFISAWVIFSSANQVESRFRCLGEQKTDGHNTWVIGFAQIPGSVESPGLIMSGGETVPMFLQGIAWIDQTDFSIVHLRTDLLAPKPEVSIQSQTANISFGPARIPSLDVMLWLPKSAHIEMETKGQLFQEDHKYSKYRLYQTSSKIVPVP